MGRSLGLGFFLENGNKKDETYHVASCCCSQSRGGGALGYFLGGYMCRPGLQIATPF